MLHMHMAQINKEPIQEVDEQELERMLEEIYDPLEARYSSTIYIYW